MGSSQSLYKDHQFAQQYDLMQERFVKQKPLFDVKDIKFPLSTRQMAIVDRTNQRVKLAGGNWSGGHAARHCVGGLDCRPIAELCKDIRDTFGMNCVRLTFSIELFRKNNLVPDYLIRCNQQFYGKTSTEIFVETVNALTKSGLMVILNNHTSKSQWCCTPYDGDGLWFNEEYSEQDFFGCLEFLAKLFKDNERVIGMDVRNEVRRSHVGQPTWGDGSKFDWKKAAQTAGNRIHKIAPHWLIIIGGMNYQTDFTQVKEKPIKLSLQNKLVYSGHLYYFTWGPDLLWSCFSEQYFRERWFNSQLFIRSISNGVPFLMGEFGNNTRNRYWIYLIKYMKELDLDWTYWCLDGYKCDDQQDQTYGVWNKKFSAPRHPEMLRDLKSIGRPSIRPL